MAEQRDHGDRPGTGAEQVEVVAAGDRQHHVDGFLERLDVGGEAPFALRRGRVAPAHGEGLQAAAHGIADQALFRRQVEHVVLVDLRGHHQQRALVDAFGERLVLDQLQHFVAEHHRALGGGQVAADLEGRLVHLAGHAAVLDQVLDQLREAVQHALAAGIQQALERRRIGQGVGRRQGVGEQADEELAAAGVLLGQVAAGDPLVQRTGPGQVALHVAAVQRVAAPGRVAEALVACLRLQFRAAQQHVLQLAAQCRGIPGAVQRLHQGLAQDLPGAAEQVAAVRSDHRVQGQRVLGSLPGEFLVFLAHRDIHNVVRIPGGAGGTGRGNVWPEGLTPEALQSMNSSMNPAPRLSQPKRTQ
ncbi:hypothetical protein D3C76_667990 [compost metagenome]